MKKKAFLILFLGLLISTANFNVKAYADEYDKICLGDVLGCALNDVEKRLNPTQKDFANIQSGKCSYAKMRSIYEKRIVAIKNIEIKNQFEYNSYYSEPHYTTFISDDGKYADTTYHEGGTHITKDFTGTMISFDIENKCQTFSGTFIVLIIYQTKGDMALSILNMLSKDNFSSHNLSLTWTRMEVKDLEPKEKRHINFIYNKTFTKGVESIEPFIIPFPHTYKIDSSAIKKKGLSVGSTYKNNKEAMDYLNIDGNFHVISKESIYKIFPKTSF